MQSANSHEASEDLLIIAIGKASWRQRKKLVIAAAAMLVVSVAIGWSTHLRWAATARVLPPADQSSRLPFDVGSLSALTGIRLGGSSSVELYPAIFFSDAVLLQVLAMRFPTSDSTTINLVDEWTKPASGSSEKRRQIALAKLRRSMNVSTDRKSDVVTLVVESRDPMVSVAIANAILDRAESFQQSNATTSAGNQRAFIENRLGEISEHLRSAEQTLLEFRSTNRNILGSPHVQMEHDRLVRDVEIQTTIYTELRTQLELARAEEARNTPIMRILDRASASIRPANSKIRSATVVFVLGLAAMTLAIVFVDLGRNARTISRTINRPPQ